MCGVLFERLTVLFDGGTLLDGRASIDGGGGKTARVPRGAVALAPAVGSLDGM